MNRKRTFRFKLNSKLRKMSIPLRFFEKLNNLTPSQVRYLQDYSARIRAGNGNPALLEKIGIILRKPQIKDPILNYDYRIDYDKYKIKKKK